MDTKNPRVAYFVGVAVGLTVLVVSIVLATVGLPDGSSQLPVDAGLVTGAPPEDSVSSTPTSTPDNSTTVPIRTEAPPTATPDPPPAAGTILYEADFSTPIVGAEADWHFSGGMLLSDGSGRARDGEPSIVIPYVPKSPDYAVEADIQVVAYGANEGAISGRVSFGLVLRDGFKFGFCEGVGLYECYGDSQEMAVISSGDPHDPIVSTAFNPSTDWHAYRAEVKGNSLVLSVDGQSLLSIANNSYLDRGRIGLWSDGVQITVRSLRVVAV